MFRLQTRAKTKSGWKMLPDCKFSSLEAAQSYVLKYWTDKSGARMARIIEIADASTISRAESDQGLVGKAYRRGRITIEQYLSITSVNGR